MLDGLQWKRRARRVIALMEAERRLLRAASIEDLRMLAERRERLVRDLTATPMQDEPEARQLLNTIRQSAVRNQRLLAAFQDGLQRARRRMEEIEQASGDLGVYTRSGTRLASPGRQSISDRRA